MTVPRPAVINTYYTVQCLVAFAAAYLKFFTVGNTMVAIGLVIIYLVMVGVTHYYELDDIA